MNYKVGNTVFFIYSENYRMDNSLQ